MQKKKNLLYVFADQWRAQAVAASGLNGQDPVLTPNMARFSQQSMVFTNAISTYPLCSPHRASLLTGKYPTSCGMWTNCKPGLDETLMLKPQEVCISDVLKAEGYDTAYIGKWHLDASELNFYKHPDSKADNWDAFTPCGERRHHFDFWHSYGAMDNHIDPHYWENSSEQIHPGKWSPEHETDVALEYLHKHDKNKPFCMFVSWNPPHPPYDLVPKKYMDIYKNFDWKFRDNVPAEKRNSPEFLKTMQQYFAAISGLDENFGRILQYLKDSGLEKDTVVVLSADHGDAMGSHGLMGKNIWYEESINIPLMVRGDGIKPGQTDVLIASPDHMPTLLDFLGLQIPDTVEGVSLAPVLRGETMENEPQTAFLCMIPGMPDMVNEYRKQGLNNKCFGWRGIRTKTHTYVVNNGTHPDVTQTRLLYDNHKDPFQMNPEILLPNSPKCKEYDNMLKNYFEMLNDPFLLADSFIEGVTK